jgi:mannose-6-phosphate isomerase-like protein (cupin superfamily)
MDRLKDVLAAVGFSNEKLKKVNLFDTDRMFCDVYGLEPGQEQKPHAHAGSDKVYYVIAGSAVFAVGDEALQAGPGYACLAPSGVIHAVRNPGPDRLSLLVFMAPKP